MQVVFFGDLATDVVITGEGECATSGPSFHLFSGTQQEWRQSISAATRQANAVIVAPGGSMANAAAAFADTEGHSFGTYVVTEIEDAGLLGPQIGDAMFDRCALDLKKRGLKIVGAPLAEILPTAPSAVVTLDSTGKVCDITARQGRAIHARIPSGNTFVCRLDHLELLSVSDLQHYSALIVLLTDDSRNAAWIESFLSYGLAVTVFGNSTQIDVLRNTHSWADAETCTTVRTHGSHPVRVRCGGRETIYPVNPASLIQGDLGAGDAYLGGWVAGLSMDADIAACHRLGAEAARRALGSLTARAAPVTDFNRLLPKTVQRVSQADDEITILDWIALGAGIAVVSGGQTGVETWAVEEAGNAGVPTFVVHPQGQRREHGAPLDMCNAHAFALGTSSYRYRTWFTVFASDGVLLLDWHHGEGSQEARAAAAHFGRPVYSLTVTTSSENVAAWLQSNGIRAVLIAGNRESAFNVLDRQHAKRAVAVAVAGIVSATARVAMLTDGNREVRRCDAVARAAATWAKTQKGLVTAKTEIVSSREAVSGLVAGKYNRILSWPSLLPAENPKNTYSITPLGAFACNYTFIGRSPLKVDDVLGIQYADAFERHGIDLLPEEMSHCVQSIKGKAEAAVSAGDIDLAYDTLATGRTVRKYGLSFVSPTHWDTLSLISATDA